MDLLGSIAQKKKLSCQSPAAIVLPKGMTKLKLQIKVMIKPHRIMVEQSLRMMIDQAHNLEERRRRSPISNGGWVDGEVEEALTELIKEALLRLEV